MKRSKALDRTTRNLHMLLALLLCLALVPVATAQATTLPDEPSKAAALAPSADASITTATDTRYITKYGNVYLYLTCKELSDAGFEYGDVLDVTFLDQSLELPLCLNYSDIDSGEVGAFSKPSSSDYVYMAIGMGDFATTYGIATKSTSEDQSFVWNYPEGVEGPIEVTISLAQKAGYLDEWTMRQLHYTNVREDYPQLSDAQFANFREVQTTGMGAGDLYRSASPIYPDNARNTYADAAARDAGVTVVVNLADDAQTAASYEGYAQSHYATATTHIELSMGVDTASDDFRAKLAQGLRFMADNPGTYLVHCIEGKDRTGFVVAVLECLMGASEDEVVADYMTTFYNYYGVLADDMRYEVISRNITKALLGAFELDDLAGADLAVEARQYVAGLGLTEDQIDSLRRNLGWVPQTYTVSFDVGGHGSAPSTQQVEAGSCATEPDAPTTEGYAFGGWYVDEALAQPYDFATPVEADLMLHARWTADEASDEEQDEKDDETDDEEQGEKDDEEQGEKDDGKTDNDEAGDETDDEEQGEKDDDKTDDEAGDDEQEPTGTGSEDKPSSGGSAGSAGSTGSVVQKGDVSVSRTSEPLPATGDTTAMAAPALLAAALLTLGMVGRMRASRGR